MHAFIASLRDIFEGDIHTTTSTRERYSHDASIYEMVPEAVLYPRHAKDIKTLVREVVRHKATHPALAITPRSAGTDMSGASIGNSILIDMTKHFDTLHSVTPTELHTQPGVYMHTIDPATNAKGVMLGCVPASRALCTIGGMVGNNSGGEQSLRYGNTENFVKELKVVFADGHEYTVRPLTKPELDVKMTQGDFEGEIYRKVYNLIEKNYDQIKNARPRVNKNSMGYNLWSVWDRDTGIFDLTRLITGSQGTLGIVTDIKMKLVPKAPYSGLLMMYLPDIKQLGDIIPAVMDHHPATFEGFDDITFELGVKHFNLFRKQIGHRNWLKMQTHLLGSVAKFKGHLPHMVLMAEFEGDTPEEVRSKIEALQADIKRFKMKTTIEDSEASSAPFWSIRRASLMLLRQKVHDKYASPFIDDLTVQPKYLPEFLPQLRKIIRKYKLPATIAGHYGDGNFHIIPLMSITDPKDQAKLEPVMREVIPLVLKYKGTLAGEHNDGMVRGPWLPAVFGDEVYRMFRRTKDIFDPQNIFNPHVKTNAAWDFSMEHIRTNHAKTLIK